MQESSGRDIRSSSTSETAPAVDIRVFANWKQSALQIMLRIGGVCLCLVPLVTGLLTHTFPGYFWLVALAGLILILVAPMAPRAHRAFGASYLLVLFAVVAAVGYYNAWTPPVVATLCYLAVASGLLFGPWALAIVAFATSGVMVLGGWLIQSGLMAIPMHALLDPNSVKNWIRVSITFVFIVSMSTLVLRFVVETASRIQEQASVALQAAHERLQAAMQLRATRVSQEDSLRRSQRLQMVAQLGEGFAHLFNNMLTVVRCGCDELRRIPSSAGIQKAAQDIVSMVRECADRAREMLVMSRTTEDAFTEVQLDRVIADSFAKLTERLRANVRCRLEATPCSMVRMPPTWLEQMLTNLLLNAEQALPEGGQVRVQTSTATIESSPPASIDILPPGHYAVLSVSDDGVGMSDQVAERACEPFYSTFSPARHAGLGLTLVHGMARQLGGSLEIRRLPKGTEIAVFLPTTDLKSAPNQDQAAATVETAVRVPDPKSQVVAEAPANWAPSTAPPTSAPPAPHRPVLKTEPTRFDWRDRTLNQILWVIGGVLFIQSLVNFYLGYSLIAGAYLAAPLVLVALTLSPRIPYGGRLWAMLTISLALILTTIINSSFLIPGAMAGLACVAFLAAVYGTRRTTIATLVIISSSLAGVAWLWTQTDLHGSATNVLVDHPSTWFRVAITVPVVITGIAVVVLRVVATARRHTMALVQAGGELEQSHAVYQAETEALLRLEETRSRASRMEAGGLLTGMMAHDLNNCLCAIIGWADLLKVDGDRAEIDDAVTAISRSADYAESLVQQLQHRTGIDHRGPSLDIGDALGRMASMLDATSRKKLHAVSVHIDAGKGCFVPITEHSLRRLVLNLVTNARDACGEQEGRCDIRAWLESSTVALQVSDNGIGMDEATRSRLFQAFFTTKGTQGTGLGLHSVMEIVKGTNGVIDVWSQVGSGTRMTIRWPVGLPPVSEVVSSPSAARDTGKARILLAEDHAIVRQAMARGLRQAGYAVTEAGNGDDALAQVEGEGVFDVLCTDAIMPGQPVTRLIERFGERYPGRPILVVSGYMPEDLLPLLQSKPQVQVLPKPVTHTQVIHAIETRIASALRQT